MYFYSVIHVNKKHNVHCNHPWNVYCVAYLATKVDPPIHVGTKVGTKFVNQNIMGIESSEQIDGSVQCDVVQEPMATSWQSFWFKGPHSNNFYRITLLLLQSGVEEYWESNYFAGLKFTLFRNFAIIS